MYIEKDFESIDIKNYTVLNKTAYHIILKHNGTGHIWDIECRELHRGQQQLVISHKHNDDDPFHEQPNMHPKTFTEAQEMIRKHDEWVLDRQKKKKS